MKGLLCNILSRNKTHRDLRGTAESQVQFGSKWSSCYSCRRDIIWIQTNYVFFWQSLLLEGKQDHQEADKEVPSVLFDTA